MPTPYPIALRERTVALLESGKEPLEVSLLMNLGVATVGRWKRTWKERGSVEPLAPRGGITEKLGVDGKEFLLSFVEQHADATLADMVEALHNHRAIHVSDSTISEFLVERGYTWKKKTFRLKEKDAEALLEMQAKFVADVASLDPEKVVYLDECGANEAMTPTRARALEGERAFAPRPTRRGEKDHGDNEQVRIAVERAGCKVKLLPPYSPDLNPIEEAWSKLKHLLRKLSARSRDALLDGVVMLVDRITAEDARGWIAHAGYPCA